VPRLRPTELRRRVQVGLNKGEARNSLARAVFFNRQGDLRDRSFENERYRASGLNLIVDAIISGTPCTWNGPERRGERGTRCMRSR
jgi:TnpA family transposase